MVVNYFPSPSERTSVRGFPTYSLHDSLVHIPTEFHTSNPSILHAALLSLKDAAPMIKKLGTSRISARRQFLAQRLIELGRFDIAQQFKSDGLEYASESSSSLIEERADPDKLGSASLVLRNGTMEKSRRAKLISSHQLLEIASGWCIRWNSNAAVGNSKEWEAGLFEFIGTYAREHMKSDWLLSPQTSLQLHLGATLPKVIFLHSTQQQWTVPLCGGFRMTILKMSYFPEPHHRSSINGIPAFSLESAIVRAPSPFLSANPEILRDALGRLQDADTLLDCQRKYGTKARAKLLHQALIEYGRADLAHQFVPSNCETKEINAGKWSKRLRDKLISYGNHYFGKDWCASPVLSLQLHLGAEMPTVIYLHGASHFPANGPKRLGLGGILGSGFKVYSKRVSRFPASALRTTVNGIPVYSLEGALMLISHFALERNPIIFRESLLRLQSVSKLIEHLQGAGLQARAHLLAQSFIECGRPEFGQKINEALATKVSWIASWHPKAASRMENMAPSMPEIARLRQLWFELRPAVIRHWSLTKRSNADASSILSAAASAHLDDARHSLALEGYASKLMNRTGLPISLVALSITRNTKEAAAGDAATQGYSRANFLVRKSLASVLKGQSAASVARKDIDAWRAALLQPLVLQGCPPFDVGAASGNAIREWRKSAIADPIFGTPTFPAASLDAVISQLFDLLEQEPHPGVRVVLGLFMFTYINPCIAGSGWLARFLMNLMLGAAGWPWTIVPKQYKQAYGDALRAGARGDITPLTKLITGLVPTSHE